LTRFGYLHDEADGSTDVTSPLCFNFVCLMHQLHKEPMKRGESIYVSVIDLEGKQYVNP